MGELTFSEHVIKVANVHVGMNKQKILVVLYSSKTHSKGSRPQKIKITADKHWIEKRFNRNFCPFTLVKEYMISRGGYDDISEPFFIFRDNTPVWPPMCAQYSKWFCMTLALTLVSTEYTC